MELDRWQKSRFSWVAKIDHKIAHGVLGFRHPWVTRFFRFMSLMGEGKSWLVFVLGLGILNRLEFFNIPHATSFFNATLASLFAWGISTGLKKLIRRERPYQAYPESLNSLYPTPLFDSFPSSHTSASFAFFFALYWIGHPLAWLVGLWAFIVASSRVYLGVHFFSDILGGLAVAGLGTVIFTFLPL